MTEAQEQRIANIRETERLLGLGMSHAQIAAQLRVHPRTVADYAAVIHESETKASRKAKREGHA